MGELLSPLQLDTSLSTTAVFLGTTGTQVLAEAAAEKGVWDQAVVDNPTL